MSLVIVCMGLIQMGLRIPIRGYEFIRILVPRIRLNVTNPYKGL